MSVEPGFGGQSFIEQTLTKLAQTRQLIGSRQVKIQVDGGVSRQTIARIAQAGADLVVAGTAIFGAANPAQEVEALRELCR
jgi:ribulose-phosphate 3-epimerase